MPRSKKKLGWNEIKCLQQINECLEGEVELEKNALALLIYASKKSFVNLPSSKKKFYSCVQYTGITR